MALASLEIYEDYSPHTVGMRTNVRVRGTRDDSTDNASYSGNMTWSRDGVYQGVIGPVTVSFVAGSLESASTLVSTVQAPSGTTTWPYTAFPGEVVSLDLAVANDVDPLDTGSDTLTDARLCYPGTVLQRVDAPNSPSGTLVTATDTSVAVYPPSAVPDHWAWSIEGPGITPSPLLLTTTVPSWSGVFTAEGNLYVEAVAWHGVPEEPGSVAYPYDAVSGSIFILNAYWQAQVVGNGATVNFTAAAPSYHGSITATWDFGDGGTSTETNPSHTYAASGVYTVTVTVTDSLGYTDSGTNGVLLPNYDYVSALTITIPVPTVYIGYLVDGLLVGFEGSYDNFVGEVTFLWDFGDGTTSDYQWPTYTYAAPGEYLVTFTVTEVGGEQRSATYSETITLTPPVGLALTYVADGLTVTFTATVENPVPGYAFDWDFGDGSSELDWNNTTTSTVTHTYNASGGYDVYVYYATEGPTLDSEHEWVTVSGPTNVLWGIRVFGTAKSP